MSNKPLGIQQLFHFHHALQLRFLWLVISANGQFVQLVNNAFEIGLVFENQLLTDDLQIPSRIDFAFNVCDIVIIKSSTQMEQRITSAYVRQESLNSLVSLKKLSK